MKPRTSLLLGALAWLTVLGAMVAGVLLGREGAKDSVQETHAASVTRAPAAASGTGPDHGVSPDRPPCPPGAKAERGVGKQC